MARAVFVLTGVLALSSIAWTCGYSPYTLGPVIVAQRNVAGGLVEYEMTFNAEHHAPTTMTGVRGIMAPATGGSTTVVEGELIFGDVWPGLQRGTPDTVTVRAPVGQTPHWRWNFRQRDESAYGGAQLGISGGQVYSAGWAAGATFGGNFAAPTWALVYRTDQPAERDRFADQAAVFRPTDVDRYQLRIQVGEAPRGPTVTVWFTPSAAAGKILWARVPTGADPPSAEFDTYVPMDSSEEITLGRLQAQIPTAAFKDLGGGTFEAIVIAAAPHLEPRAASAPVAQRCPLPSCVVTRGFSATPVDHPIHAGTRPHYGTDYQAPRGTNVVASAAGAVERSDARDGAGFGNVVIVRHDDGSASLYAHLDRRDVFVGDIVEAGEHIGYSGATGGARGAHLHYELVQSGIAGRGGTRVDPVLHLVVSDRTVSISAAGVVTFSEIAGTLYVVTWDGEVVGYFGEYFHSTATVRNVSPGVHTLVLGYQGGVACWLGFCVVDASIDGGLWEAADAVAWGIPGVASPTYDNFVLLPPWGSGEGFTWKTFSVTVP